MVIRNGISSHDFIVWMNAELKRRKLNQAEFSKMIGVSESVISRWRWNRQEPSWTMISRILRALDHHFEIVPDEEVFNENSDGAKDRYVNKVIRAFERYEGMNPIEEKNDYTEGYLCGDCMSWINPSQNYCWKCGRRIVWRRERKNGNQEN